MKTIENWQSNLEIKCSRKDENLEWSMCRAVIVANCNLQSENTIWIKLYYFVLQSKNRYNLVGIKPCESQVMIVWWCHQFDLFCRLEYLAGIHPHSSCRTTSIFCPLFLIYSFSSSNNTFMSPLVKSFQFSKIQISVALLSSYWAVISLSWPRYTICFCSLSGTSLWYTFSISSSTKLDDLFLLLTLWMNFGNIRSLVPSQTSFFISCSRPSLLNVFKTRLQKLLYSPTVFS